MSDETNEPSIREQRVNAAIAVYLEAVDAGEAPDPKEFIAAHRDIAADLESCFANRDEFERMAEPLQAAGPAALEAQHEDVTLPPAGDRTKAPTLMDTTVLIWFLVGAGAVFAVLWLLRPAAADGGTCHA